jgi:hypothetical protein
LVGFQPSCFSPAESGRDTHLSPDPEQEYFADGMVEDIITGPSRIRWLRFSTEAGPHP